MLLRLMVTGVTLICVGGSSIARPATVHAHALLQRSDPEAGASLERPPPALTLSFGEQPDPALSRVDLLDPSQAPRPHGPLTADPSDPRTLRETVAPLSPGVYTVAWRTVSVIDGHTAAGTFAFGVGVSPDAARVTSNGPAGGTGSSPGPEAVGGRFLLYVGLVLLAGSAFVALLVFPVPPRRTVASMPLAWAGTLLGLAMVGDAQRRDAGISLGAVAATSIGHGLLVRGCVAVVTGACALAAPLTRARIHRGLIALAGLGALASMGADVQASHAASGDRPLFDALLQFVHIGAAGAWIGGLAALLLGLPGAGPAARVTAIRRFSTAAGVGLILVAATGVLRAIPEVGAWDRLLGTTYGGLVVAKAAVIVVLALLGAVNRFANVGKALTSDTAGLRRIAGSEVVAGMAAIVLASALVNTTPPSQLRPATAAPAVSPLAASGYDDGTTVRVRLQVSPGLAGFNRFSAEVTTFDTGAPVTDANVVMHFTFATAVARVGTSALQFTHLAGGTYTATGGNLSLDGAWNILVLVDRGAASADVPLHLTTRATPTRVDVSRVAGLPTLYTVHLPAGRTVQMYIDPDHAGRVIFHATFFGSDAAGTELPVTGSQVTERAPGRPPVYLDARELEPGHFVADATVPSASTTFEVTALTAEGERLDARANITPGG